MVSKVNYICEKCKSDDILFDAYATWDENSQNFSMTQCFGVGGDIVCNECGHKSTHADEVSYITDEEDQAWGDIIHPQEEEEENEKDNVDFFGETDDF